jgi:hypothetical protein
MMVSIVRIFYSSDSAADLPAISKTNENDRCSWSALKFSSKVAFDQTESFVCHCYSSETMVYQELRTLFVLH